MSHSIEVPVAFHYRGKGVFFKFDWKKPNDISPVGVHILEEGSIVGLANIVVSLTGPWDDYQCALAAATLAAERWIDRQMQNTSVASL